VNILFYGNTDNLGFRVTKALRTGGFNAHLLLYTDVKMLTSSSDRSLPEFANPQYNNNYPEWVHTCKRSFLDDFFITFAAKKIVDKVNPAIILTSGNCVVPAVKTKLPVIFIPGGSDITKIPFGIRSDSYSSNIKKRLKCGVFLYLITKLLNCYSWLRAVATSRAIKKDNLTAILTSQEDCIWASKFLDVYNKVVLFPIYEDVSFIKSNINKDLYEKLTKKYSQYKLVFMALSRKNINPSDIAYKGQEKILYAFQSFVSKTKLGPDDIRLVLGMHGNNVDEFRYLISSLSLEPYVEQVGHLNTQDLHTYVSLDNACVLDEFGTSAEYSLGGLARETLCIGTPIVSATKVYDERFINSHGKECPLIPAYTEEEIEKAMSHLLDLDRKKYKEQSTKWMLENFDWKVGINKLSKVLNK